MSEVPGTTRDMVSASVTMDGHAVHLTDTAGLRASTSDLIEKEGMQIAREEINNSHAILLVLDVSTLEQITDHVFALSRD